MTFTNSLSSCRLYTQPQSSYEHPGETVALSTITDKETNSREPCYSLFDIEGISGSPLTHAQQAVKGTTGFAAFAWADLWFKTDLESTLDTIFFSKLKLLLPLSFPRVCLNVTDCFSLLRSVEAPTSKLENAKSEIQTLLKSLRKLWSLS